MRETSKMIHATRRSARSAARRVQRLMDGQSTPNPVRGKWVEENSLNNERFTFSVPLPEIGPDMNPAAAAVALPRGTRGRRATAILEKQRSEELPLADRSGINGLTAVIALVGFVVVLGIILLSSAGHLFTSQAQVNETMAQIQKTRAACETLQDEIDTAAKEINLSYLAVEAGMYFSKTTADNTLTVPDAVHWSLSQDQSAE